MSNTKVCIIDKDPATDALAEILYELIEINEGGNDLQDAAKKVEVFFKHTNYDFGKQTLEKLEALRIHSDSQTARDLYRALQRIATLKHLPCSEVPDAVAIAEEAMRKARGEE